MEPEYRTRMLDQLGSFDCWDFGGSVDSCTWAKENLGVQNPLAINVGDSFGRLEALQGSDYSSLVWSILDLPDNQQTDVITCFHVMEHLPSVEDCSKVIQYAVKHARRAVVFTGPSFEEAAFLRRYRMKFMWDDWVDHESRYGMVPIVKELRRLGVPYSMSLGFPVHSSSHNHILNRDEPPNQEQWISDVHAAKREILFNPPLFEEMMVIAALDISSDVAVRWHRSRHGDHGISNVHRSNVDYLQLVKL